MSTYTEEQVHAILMYGRLEGAPPTVTEVVDDLRRNGKWPTYAVEGRPCDQCNGTREVIVFQDGSEDGVWSAPAPCGLCSGAVGERSDAACSDPNCSYRAEVAAGYYVRADAVGDRPCTCDGTESVDAVCAEQSPVGRWVCSHCKRPISGPGAVQSPGQGEDRPSFRDVLNPTGAALRKAEAEVKQLQTQCNELIAALQDISTGDNDPNRMKTRGAQALRSVGVW